MAKLQQRICCTWAFLMMCLWLVPQVLSQSVYGPDYVPPNPNHSLPVWLDPPRYAKVASCVVDVAASTVALGHAGTSLYAAVHVCDVTNKDTPKNSFKNTEFNTDMSQCEAAVASVVEAFSYAASFIAQAAADCKSSLQVVDFEAVKRAACAADISMLVASLAMLGKNAALAVDTCDGSVPDSVDRLADTRLLYHNEATQDQGAVPGANEQIEQNSLNGILTHRIDSPFEANNDTLAQRTAEIGMCFFDVSQATFFLAQAGLMINNAVADCSRFELRTGGQQARERCETDVKRVIGSFALVSSGISYASFHCPFWKTAQPACAGAIGSMISALADIAAVSTSFQATCKHVERRDISKLKPPEPPERHLAEEGLFV